MLKRSGGSIALIVIAVVAAGFALKVGESIFLPFTIAVMLSFALEPLLDRLVKWRLAIWIAVLVVFVFLGGVGYLIGLFLFQSARAFLVEFPRYLEIIQQALADLSQRFGIPALALETFDWNEAFQANVLPVSGSFFSFFGTFVFILITLFFILLGSRTFPKKLEAMFPNSKEGSVVHIMKEIYVHVGHYLSVKVLISLISAVLTGIVLTIAGQDFALVWAALVFFLNFIPRIGSIAVVVGIGLMSLIQFYPSWTQPLATVAVLTGLDMIVGNMIDPKLQGARLDLSPVMILISLVVFGFLWGAAGAILAVPLTAIAKIVCEHFEPLKPVAILLSSGKAFRERKTK